MLGQYAVKSTTTLCPIHASTASFNGFHSSLHIATVSQPEKGVGGTCPTKCPTKFSLPKTEMSGHSLECKTAKTANAGKNVSWKKTCQRSGMIGLNLRPRTVSRNGNIRCCHVAVTLLSRCCHVAVISSDNIYRSVGGTRGYTS